ncbi:MAG: ferredoxin family protein [Sideroxyarcus sp.]|nr:ferredoxin family protein [Sideroxyarcus sp.]
MAFVVTEKCIRCKFTDCINPCPVDCFHEGPEFLVINPDVCIECNSCAVECPVEAIYQDKDLPEAQKEFIEINRQLSQIWPRAIAGVSAPLPDREHWRTVSNKREFLLQPKM